MEDSGGHSRLKWLVISDLLLSETFFPGIPEELYHILLGWLLILHNAIKPKERGDGFLIALEGRVSAHHWAHLWSHPQVGQSTMWFPQNLKAQQQGLAILTGPKAPEPRDSLTRPEKKSFSRSSPSPISSRSTSTSWSLFLPSASICQRPGPPATTSASGERELESGPHT